MNGRTKMAVVLAIAGLCVGFASVGGAQTKDKWRVGAQSYSFNRFTFEEAVAKTKACGMKYIEVYPDQKIGLKFGDTVFKNMNAEQRQAVKQMLKDNSVTLTCYGVITPGNEQEWRKLFDFAKEMGFENIVSEPAEKDLPMIDKLCEEYKIGVAIHNHPQPSHYWNYETVLKACAGRSKWIGACADTGHWTRSNIDPVVAIKALGQAGRIRSLHFKDLNKFGGDAHDVPWGTGVSKAREVLVELAAEGFEGAFSAEYEWNWDNSVPEITKCAEWFKKTAAELSDTPAGPWTSLFNGKDLTGWDGEPRLWSVKEGVIHGETTAENPIKSNTFLVYRGGSFDDFELHIKFRLLGGNSGVQYRSKEFEKWRMAGYQADILDTLGMVGFLYEEGGRAFLANLGEFVVVSPNANRNVIGSVCDKQALIDAGYYKVKDWNEYRIICRANHIVQYLNGYKTIELLDNDRLINPTDPKDRRGASRTGLIGLQLHVGPPMVVEFKDIRLQRITPPCADAVLAFNGRNLDEWTTNPGSGKANKWVVGKAKLAADPKQLERVEGTGEMINLSPEHGASQDLYSKAKFGDCRIEVQVMVPQGSNSGIYVMGEYEIQVLDSYGREKMTGGDMGAIYNAAVPSVNASKKPGEWQQYVIELKAPRFDASGKKTQNAEFVKVELNGQVLHRNLVMPGATPGGVTGHEVPEGPLMFQGNHGPVAYRNIIVTPLK